VRVAFVSLGDPDDARNWSGIPRAMRRALEAAGCAVQICAPLRDHLKWLYAPRKLAHRRYGRHFDWTRMPVALHFFAAQIRRHLRACPADLVFCPSTIPIAMLDCRPPIVFWTDAIAEQMFDYYPTPYFSDIPEVCRRAAAQQERAALSRAALGVYSSSWAAEAARSVHGACPERLMVLPFGSNLDSVPSPAEIERVIALRASDHLRLLFIGMEWERKGGPVALAVTAALNARGRPASLVVIGSPELAGADLPPWVQYLGVCDKNSPDGAGRITEELARAHFLLLPTLADATPVVISEAASFGVPTVATRTGGLSTMVRLGRNGWLLEPGAAIDRYLEVLEAGSADPAVYRRMCFASHAFFHEQLDWQLNMERLLRRLNPQELRAMA
jgi:glycosyltransferase involved in cell wall biosynthesis